MTKMKQEFTELLQTEITRIVKTNEQSLKQAKTGFENLFTQR